jgi:hypothetical protein
MKNVFNGLRKSLPELHHKLIPENEASKSGGNGDNKGN